MSYKKLMPMMYLKDEKCFLNASFTELIGDGNPVTVASRFSDDRADEIIILDMSEDSQSHEKAIAIIREITKLIDIPVIAGGNVKRVEDVKKYLYAGARTALLEDSKESNLAIMKEVVDRFGNSKIGLLYTGADHEAIQMAKDNQIAFLLMKEKGHPTLENENKQSENYDLRDDIEGIPSIIHYHEGMYAKLAQSNVYGITGPDISRFDCNFMSKKLELREKGIEVNTFQSSIPFSEFKLNSDGLIPVVVQDYKTDDVLMVAYMNEESYQMTVETGRMTYYSRSRQKLWIKGLTSGHFQYVRSLEIDCDNDTLLAKVKQIGAACHTGNRSCFYRNLVTTEYAQTNPLKVLNRVMAIIEDRKNHPKQGSYTNYLFEQGIDKVLKKCGEEATEIIIAAKNPDPEEIKYEISDFLYHVMVLMELKGVTWEDIMKELANR